MKRLKNLWMEKIIVPYLFVPLHTVSQLTNPDCCSQTWITLFSSISVMELQQTQTVQTSKEWIQKLPLKLLIISNARNNWRSQLIDEPQSNPPVPKPYGLRERERRKQPNQTQWNRLRYIWNIDTDPIWFILFLLSIRSFATHLGRLFV